MDISRVWDEIVLLRSTLLPDEFSWRGTPDETEVWERVYEACQDGQPLPMPVPPQQVHLSLCVNKQLGVSMNVKLNEFNARPGISVLVQRTDLISQAQLTDMVQQRLDECALQDISHRTFDVLNLLHEITSEIEEVNECISVDQERFQHAVARQANAPSLAMKRVIFWSHHLVAPSKRRQFAAWCPELGVWGLFKLGYPGFLCFEGACDDVDDMVRRVKGMQWAAISMRTEVAWTFIRTDDMLGTTLEAAIRHCPLAKAHPLYEKVRTGAKEIESMSEFVAWYVIFPP